VDEMRLSAVTASAPLHVPWEMTGGLSHPLLEKLRLPAGTTSAPKGGRGQVGEVI
jgi:hypothetical protein